MSYQFEYQEKAGYLYVHVLGERTQDAVISLTRELSQKAIERGFTRILVDVRELKGWLQVMESNYIVTTEFPKFRGSGLKRAAILDREPAEPQRWSFFETVAQNRGFELRVFTELDLARQWLLEGLNLQAST